MSSSVWRVEPSLCIPPVPGEIARQRRAGVRQVPPDVPIGCQLLGRRPGAAVGRGLCAAHVHHLGAGAPLAPLLQRAGCVACSAHELRMGVAPYISSKRWSDAAPHVQVGLVSRLPAAYQYRGVVLRLTRGLQLRIFQRRLAAPRAIVLCFNFERVFMGWPVTLALLRTPVPRTGRAAYTALKGHRSYCAPGRCVCRSCA